MSKEYENIDIKIQQIEQLIHKGKIDDANQSLVLFEKNEDIKIDHQLKCSLLKSKIKIKAGNLEEGLKHANNTLKRSQELGKNHLIAESLHIIGRIYSIKGVKDIALDYFEKSLALYKKVGNEKEIAWSLWNIGAIYCHKGKFDAALDHFKLSKDHFERFDDKEGHGQALYCMSAMNHDKGELDLALEYQLQTLRLFKELGNKSEIAKSLAKIGFIYLSKGDLDRAFENQQQSIALYDEIDKSQKSWALVGIGEVYRLKGELDRALTYLEQSLSLRKDFGHDEDIAECLYYIGKIFHQQGKLDPAWEYLEESLTFLNEPDDNLFITGILLDLVSLAIEKHFHEHSAEYLKRLKRINDQEENMIIDQRYRMAKALFLKKSTRIRDKALVQDIFQQIAEEEIVDHRITVAAMYNLCESLLDELKAYGEVSVMLEAKSLAKKLTTLAHKQSSPLLAIDALILQAKLAMVEGDLSDAEELLEQAKSTAEDKNLGFYIATKVSTERGNLEDQYDAWQRLIKNNAPFKERLEQARLKNYLNEALKLARVGKDHKACE
ncbi:MAG: tetratricopeptide repeat protein [Candidatus Hermodarchaeota archaeon]